jgi:hypothetical protein
MFMMRACGALLVLVTGVAVAQPRSGELDTHPTVDDLVAKAGEQAKLGDYPGAAASFRQAWRLDRKRTELLCNIGVAYFKARDLPRAHLYLSQCQTRAGDLDRKFLDAVDAARQSTQAKLQAAEFAPVNVVVAPEGARVEVSAFDPEDTFVDSRAVWLPYGTHTVTVRSDGFLPHAEQVIVSSHAPIEVHVTLEVVPPRRLQRVERPTTAYIGLAVTGLGVLVTGALYYEAAHKVSEVDPSPGNASYPQQRDAASTWRTRFIIGAVATGAIAGVTGYLWFGRARHFEVLIPATGQGGGVSYGGAF